MVVCVVFLWVVLLTGPYIRRIDDRMCQVVQTHLFLILLMGYVLQNTPYVVGSAEDLLGSVIMLIVLFALIVLLLYHGGIFARNWFRNWQRSRAKHKEVHLTEMPAEVLDLTHNSSTHTRTATNTTTATFDEAMRTLHGGAVPRPSATLPPPPPPAPEAASDAVSTTAQAPAPEEDVLPPAPPASSSTEAPEPDATEAVSSPRSQSEAAAPLTPPTVPPAGLVDERLTVPSHLIPSEAAATTALQDEDPAPPPPQDTADDV